MANIMTIVPDRRVRFGSRNTIPAALRSANRADQIPEDAKLAEARVSS